MRRLIVLLILVACGLARAGNLMFSNRSPIPQDVSARLELTRNDPGNALECVVKSHGDGTIRVPYSVIENPVVSSNQFSASGYAAFVPEKPGAGSATVEFWSDLSDGTRATSRVDLPPATQPSDTTVFDAPIRLDTNVWPIRSGVDILVTGTGSAALSYVELAQVPLVATTAPTGPVIAADEHVVRAFTRADLAPQAAGLLASEIDMSNGTFPGTDQLGAQALFDGPARSAFAVGLGRMDHSGGELKRNPDLFERVRLLDLDQPNGPEGRLALVGRLAVLTDNFARWIGAPDVSNIRLEATAEFADGLPVSGSCRLGVDQAGFVAGQPFRIDLNIKPARQLKHLRLDVVLVGGRGVIFDGIDLVAPGRGGALPASSVTASAIPASDVEQIVQTPLDHDAQIVGQSGHTNHNDPVSVDFDSDQTWGIHFNRPAIDGSPRRITIAEQDVPTLTPGTFGITGRVKYDGLELGTNLTAPAWFELTTDYVDGSRTVTGTTGDRGLACMMIGHSASRPFAVTAASALQPVRFKLELVSAGTGVVRIWPLSLVQYEPPAPPPPATQPTAVMAPLAAPPWWSVPRYTRPIGFGIAGLMGVAAVVFLVPGVASQTWGLLAVLGLVAQAAFAWGMFLLGRGQFLHDVVPLLVAPLAWLLPAISRGLVFRKVRRNELRRMFTLDAAS
jgi:hypothetical protein